MKGTFYCLDQAALSFSQNDEMKTLATQNYLVASEMNVDDSALISFQRDQVQRTDTRFNGQFLRDVHADDLGEFNPNITDSANEPKIRAFLTRKLKTEQNAELFLRHYGSGVTDASIDTALKMHLSALLALNPNDPIIRQFDITKQSDVYTDAAGEVLVVVKISNVRMFIDNQVNAAYYDDFEGNTYGVLKLGENGFELQEVLTENAEIAKMLLGQMQLNSMDAYAHNRVNYPGQLLPLIDKFENTQLIELQSALTKLSSTGQARINDGSGSVGESLLLTQLQTEARKIPAAHATLKKFPRVDRNLLMLDRFLQNPSSLDSGEQLTLRLAESRAMIKEGVFKTMMPAVVLVLAYQVAVQAGMQQIMENALVGCDANSFKDSSFVYQLLNMLEKTHLDRNSDQLKALQGCMAMMLTIDYEEELALMQAKALNPKRYGASACSAAQDIIASCQAEMKNGGGTDAFIKADLERATGLVDTLKGINNTLNQPLNINRILSTSQAVKKLSTYSAGIKIACAAMVILGLGLLALSAVAAATGFGLPLALGAFGAVIEGAEIATAVVSGVASVGLFGSASGFFRRQKTIESDVAYHHHFKDQLTAVMNPVAAAAVAAPVAVVPPAVVAAAPAVPADLDAEALPGVDVPVRPASAPPGF